MPDISLLPENLRGKEERETKTKPPAADAGAEALKMHLPPAAVEEDVEIIEVDESELGVVLAGEPLITRLAYKFSATLDALKDRFFKPREAVPPPKLPPQFFTPPKPSAAIKPAAAGKPPHAAPAPPPAVPTAAGAPAPAAVPAAPPMAAQVAVKHKALITPQAEVPRRVRVIKRTRKAVRVSLIPAEELAYLTVDTGRRKWTLAVLGALFLAILTGGYVFLSSRVSAARAVLSNLESDIAVTRKDVREEQKTWSAYQDLQPRLVLLNQLLTNHVVISRLFDFLETRTLPEVSYRSASLSPNGTLTLDVVAGSFGAAARQLASFERSALVKRVEATAFTAEQDGSTGAVKQVSFQLILTLDAASLRGPALAMAGEEKTVMSVVTSTPP